MLSYQHAYHAGNFADVHKHALLAKLLRVQASSPQSLHVVDTHAGRGLYDLGGEEAQKTGEYHFGIGPVYDKRVSHPKLADYLSIVEGLNAGGDLRAYPGSPLIVQSFLRKQDSLLLLEKHPAEHAALVQAMAGKTNVKVEKGDGFSHLETLRPLPGKRGLVIVDPSYEIKSEYETLPRLLARAKKAWVKAMFFVWYPILPAKGHISLLESIYQLGAQDSLISEITLDAPLHENFGMTGAGVIIINPPFGFEGAVREIGENIAGALPVAATSKTFWLGNLRPDQETRRLVLP